MFTDVSEARAAYVFRVESPTLKTEAARSIELSVSNYHCRSQTMLQQNTGVTPLKSSNGGGLQIYQKQKLQIYIFFNFTS
jgi:hypothetical protein